MNAGSATCGWEWPLGGGCAKTILEHVAAGNIAIGTTSTSNDTLLMVASRYGLLDYVVFLLDAGEDINARADDGFTALHQAVVGKQLPVVQHLINNGANMEQVRNGDGYTPLMQACADGNLPIVRCLVEFGADIHTKSETGMTALDIAHASHHAKVVDYLLQTPASAAGVGRLNSAEAAPGDATKRLRATKSEQHVTFALPHSAHSTHSTHSDGDEVIRYLRMECEERDAAIQQMRSALDAADDTIKQLRSELQARDTTIQQLRSEMNGKDARFRELQVAHAHTLSKCTCGCIETGVTVDGKDCYHPLRTTGAGATATDNGMLAIELALPRG